MDSLSQFALGAAVGIATMGRRTAPWKAALVGGIVGTLPDLDAFIDHGDPVSNMTEHRAETHALFWQTLVSPLIAAAVVAATRERAHWRRWWLAVWLALVTHPLLDAMTVYGTQLLLPFTNQPYAVGSIFIIDPLYTLPLLVGVAGALWAKGAPLRWNAVGLVLSTAYLAWSALAQQHVRTLALQQLAAQGIEARRVLVTPAPFNTLLWRIVAVGTDGYHEGYRSLLDRGDAIAFDRFERGADALHALRAHEPVATLARFSDGFVKLVPSGDELRLADLRMGQEPTYTFTFAVAQRNGDGWRAMPPERRGTRPDVGRIAPWLWRRALGESLPPPR
jgi:inner membrane protein